MQTVAMGKLLRGVIMGGQARVLLCDTRAMAQAAREIHQASNVCTAALARGINAVALLTASAEEQANSLTMTVKGGGPAGSLVAVMRDNRIKAYVDHPQVDLPLRADNKLDVGGALGHEGRMTIVRDLNLREPYIGQTALQSGEIADDLAYYFTMSEQKPTLCALGEIVDGYVQSSGGLLVQPLPGCEEETIATLEMRSPVYADVSAHLLEMTPEELFANFFRDMQPEILATEVLTYTCDCSRERMEKALISLGREELTDMIETDHAAELTCHFCRTSFQFTEEELRTLLAQASDTEQEEA